VSDKDKIEMLLQVLQDILDDDMQDHKAVAEWGGYCLDHETRQKIERAIYIGENE
jgi:hypothetical protein